MDELLLPLWPALLVVHSTSVVVEVLCTAISWPAQKLLRSFLNDSIVLSDFHSPQNYFHSAHCCYCNFQLAHTNILLAHTAVNLIGSSIYFVNLSFLQFKSDRCTKVVKIILGQGVLFATLPSWVIFTSIQSWSSINRTILISIISIWNEIYNSMSTFLQHVTFSAFDRDEQLLSDLIRLRSY